MKLLQEIIAVIAEIYLEEYMELLSIVLIAISLAMDAFAVSLTNGISVNKFQKKDAIRQGLFFGTFQFLMPIIGWVLKII